MYLCLHTTTCTCNLKTLDSRVKTGIFFLDRKREGTEDVEEVKRAFFKGNLYADKKTFDVKLLEMSKF